MILNGKEVPPGEFFESYLGHFILELTTSHPKILENYKKDQQLTIITTINGVEISNDDFYNFVEGLYKRYENEIDNRVKELLSKKEEELYSGDSILQKASQLQDKYLEELNKLIYGN